MNGLNIGKSILLGLWLVIGVESLVIGNYLIDKEIRRIDYRSDEALWQARAKKDEVAIVLCLKRHRKKTKWGFTVELCDCFKCQ